MKRILTTYFFCSFTFILFSQTINFKGTVNDEMALPVSNATVTIEGTGFSEVTDEEGTFDFNEEFPMGENIVTVTGVGFKTKFFTILVEPNKNITVEEVRMNFTKDEKRRRFVQAKIREEEERRMKRERKKVTSLLEKENEKKIKEVDIEIDEKIIETVVVKEEEIIVETPVLQEKYAKEFDVPLSNIYNLELYGFVDKWRGTTFLDGGETRNGIDDANLIKRLFLDVFEMKIEDSVQEQYDSEFTDKFTDTEYLREGDFVFFKGSGNRSKEIVHVGVFLVDNKFIHSVSLRSTNNQNGVKISDLNNPFWKARLVSGGRRIYSE